ncbi:MAG: glycosyltransferase family 39 protein, partial [Rhizobiales bacterium]|nr:glycosyltransferase family 39 protein [Hyphomicrobiales bacterium]
MTGSAAAPRGWLDTLVDFARARPGTTLAILLGFHLVVWTVLPALLSQNLQLDLAEDLALGKEWQLGYWKHPPLPWWIAEFTYQATGRIAAIYVLGPLSAVVCLAVVWLLARELVGGFQALIAVAVLEGAHFYNFSVPKFAHDQVQLPFWALTGLFFCRALLHGRVRDWALAGAMLALCFWSKYAAFALAASLALFLLFDRDARRTLVTPKPYVMAAVFLVVIAPNLWWLVTHDFMPFRYVDARARLAVTLVEDVTFPLRWIGGQIFFLLPTLALLALAYWPRPAAAAPAPGSEAFA